MNIRSSEAYKIDQEHNKFRSKKCLKTEAKNNIRAKRKKLKTKQAKCVQLRVGLFVHHFHHLSDHFFSFILLLLHSFLLILHFKLESFIALNQILLSDFSFPQCFLSFF